MKYRVPWLAAAFMGCAALVCAQQAPLKLQITAGRVTLHVQNMPVRTVLAEWARLGGSKIVNGDRIALAPVTLDLDNVPERQALDILLRGVSGYVLAAREPGATGASMYDRLMILPTSAAPRNPPPGTAAPVFSNAPGGLIRPIAPRAPQADDDDDDNGDANDGVPIARPVAIPRPPNPIGAPVMPPAQIAPDDNPPQQTPAVAATPTNPFGLPPGSSTRPGVITPSPETRPQNTPRPNGVGNGLD